MANKKGEQIPKAVSVPLIGLTIAVLSRGPERPHRYYTVIIYHNYTISDMTEFVKQIPSIHSDANLHIVEPAPIV